MDLSTEALRKLMASIKSKNATASQNDPNPVQPAQIAERRPVISTLVIMYCLEIGF